MGKAFLAITISYFVTCVLEFFLVILLDYHSINQSFLTMKQKLAFFLPSNLISFFPVIILIIAIFSGVVGGFLTLLCSAALAFAISSSVHSAEVIAKRVGPSLGAIILALSVTIIEVGLIVSMMATQGDEGATLARDTVFSTLMIVTNGILGFCLVLGGKKHKELGFEPQGTSSLLSMLCVLSALTLIIPNFTTSMQGPVYSENQLIFVSLICLVAYAVLLWAQSVTHKNYFQVVSQEEFQILESDLYVPNKKETISAMVSLILNLVTVIGLAKILSPSIAGLLAYVGAPKATLGIILALLVLAPETLAAINAAKKNQLQTSLNLALGSGAASIALTIPVVSAYTIFYDKKLILGLDHKSTAFLVFTFICSGLTFSQGKSTSLHGFIHLLIMISFVALSFMP